MHWSALKRIFQYVQSMKEQWLVLGGDEEGLTGYSDADGMSTEGRKAVSGYILRFFGTISWSSKRQEITALSTAEAEYVALVHAGKEVIWVNSMLCELFCFKPLPIDLYCDNMSAIVITKSEGYSPRTKHIDIRYHWTREQVQNGILNVTFVGTDDQLADILTKALVPVKVKRFANLLGLRICGGV